jgi:hypothetical protein
MARETEVAAEKMAGAAEVEVEVEVEGRETAAEVATVWAPDRIS